MCSMKLVDYLQTKDPLKLKIDDPGEVSAFLSALKHEKNVVALHLSDGKISIGKDVALAIGNAIANHGELEELHMFAAFKGRDIAEVTQCLEAISGGVAQSGCRLRVLNVSENALRGTGIRGLAAMLTGPSCFSLEVLNMSDQGLSPEGGRELAALIAELSQNAKSAGQRLILRSFKASKNRLENPGAVALGAVFKEVQSLEEVEMYQCGITSAGVSGLVEGLAHNLGLRFLDIVDNTANGLAEADIAHAVEKWTQLEDLRINSCLISGKGMLRILSAVKHACRSIKTLDLGENEVDKNAQEDIMDLLCKMPSLNAVVLKGNPFFVGANRHLCQQRLAAVGKENILKSQLGSHTYGLEESDNEYEEGEGEVDEGSEKDFDQSEGELEAGRYDSLLQLEGDTLWSVKLIPPDGKAEDYPCMHNIDSFCQRLERNNCFAVLGYLIHDFNKLFEEKKYKLIFEKLTAQVQLYWEKLASENNNSSRLVLDHQLEALLQYAEYLCSYGLMQVGSIVLEELLSCSGVLSSDASSHANVSLTDGQLAALAWLLHHVLQCRYIPLYTLARMKNRIDSAKNKQVKEKLLKIEGFSFIFQEIERQLA